jgi:UDP-N-acetylglucosamine 2-epimerase (non-hydrolysing)
MQMKVLSESEMEDKVCVVVGTRPSLVIASPIIREMERRDLHFFTVHTGQHYSYNMDRQFFRDLDLKEPSYKLDNVRFCKYHGEQTAEMLRGCERIFLKERPRVVLVGGDANTNLAGALAARKLHIRVGHIEAGERSGDWRMPEEHNRVIIDHISEFLFTTNAKGRDNLIRDNVKGEIFVTGNPIVDAAFQNVEIAKSKSRALNEFGLELGGYFVLTLHREENVDSRENLMSALLAMEIVAREFDTRILFLAHPRTRKRIEDFGLGQHAYGIEGLDVTESVGYLDFLQLMSSARLVLTDSGGVQQEACILKVPCVTLRENTEWTETLDIGANTLCGTQPERIVEGVDKMLGARREWEDVFGDGKSGARIVDIVEEQLGGR